MIDKYKKIIIGDIGIGLAAVAMYSPGLLALSPFSPSILKAGCSIIGAVVLGYSAIRLNFIDSKDKLITKVEDVDTIESCKKVLSNIRDSKTFGKSINEVIRQLDRSKTYLEKFPQIIDVKFPKGSMSNEKFNNTVKLACDTILKNCQTFLYRIQMFNEDDYRKNSSLIRSGEYQLDDIPDNIQIDKNNLYKKNIDSINDVIGINEGILLKLEALSIEISNMNTDDIHIENSNMINELEELINTTQYYK